MLATAMGYRLVRGFVRLLLWLFYRRVDVVGAERIPSRGPLIIVANHHNSLVDPMLIMGMVPRRITAVASWTAPGRRSISWRKSSMPWATDWM